MYTHVTHAVKFTDEMSVKPV